MNKIFKEKFPLAYKYFETVFNENKHFPQSIVFEGLDIFGQYFFALELARKLNCLNNGEDYCSCTNCNWIRENTHPEVVTVSQINFKEHDDAKTVISVKQAQNITQILSTSSDFHRVFIFLDAKTGEMEEHLKEQYKQYSGLGFELPTSDWVPNFIDYKTFHPLTLNAMLKSIEEPPNRTTFFFLTKNHNDLINTITSRSMVFRLPSKKFIFDYSGLDEIFSDYPNISLKGAFFISDKMQSFAKEKNLLPKEILNMLEQYLGDFLIENPHSEKIKHDIKSVQKAKQQLLASMTVKTVFDSLLIDLASV